VGGSDPHSRRIYRCSEHPVWGTLSASHSSGPEGRIDHSWRYIISILCDICNEPISNTDLSVVSVTEFVSRSFSANSLSTRLRPKEYKKIPESTLNATLKDIHDLIQHAVVQAQRIFFGQDLDKSFAVSYDSPSSLSKYGSITPCITFELTNQQAFLGFTGLYWLVLFVPPFWLTVMGLTSIFVAPLIFSPQGRGVAHDASVHAQELANLASEKGRVLAQNSKVMAAELSSSGKRTAADLSSSGKQTVADLSSRGKQTAADLSSSGNQTAAEISSKTKQTVADLSSSGKQTIADLSYNTKQTVADLSSRGKQAAADLSSSGNQTAAELSSKTKQAATDISAQARGTTSDISGIATENIRKLPQMGMNAINAAPDIVGSTADNAKGYISTPPSNSVNGNSGKNQYVNGGAASKVPSLSNGAEENTKRMAPGIQIGKQPNPDYLQNTVSFLPAQTGGKKTGSVADTGFQYGAAGDAAAMRGIQDRPRGAAPLAMDEA
jgi:gas vesicle protein